MHRLGSIASPLELGVNAPSQFRFELVQGKLRSAVARHFTCFTILDNEKAKVAQVPMTDERQHPSPGILTLDRPPDEGGGDGVPPESSEGLEIVLAPLAQYQSFSCYSLHDVLLSKVAILPSAAAGYDADRRGDRLRMKAAVLPAYWRVKRVLRSGLQRLGNIVVAVHATSHGIGGTIMQTHKVGYLIGSLAKDSINRKLARALVRLGPTHLTMGSLLFYQLSGEINFDQCVRMGF